MLKLTASYSKKVPLPEQQFSSQQYHASVEVELPDGLTPEQLEQRTRQTFTLVRESVERELLNGSQPQGQQTTDRETTPADSSVTGPDSQPVPRETPATATAARTQAPARLPPQNVPPPGPGLPAGR